MFNHSKSSRFRPFRTHTTTRITRVEFVEEPDLQSEPPMAVETPVANPEQIPFAKQIFNTKKLYSRWSTCCEISLRMAHIGFEHANDLERHATVWATFGILLGSQQMQDEANETSRRAHETRKSTLYLSALFLAGSVLLTGLFWAVEEGLVGTIVKSIAACGQSIAASVGSVCSGIKNKITGMFKRNQATDQNNLPKVSELEEEEDVLDGIAVQNPQEQLSSFKQELFENPPAVLNSGGPYTPPNFVGDAPRSVFPAPSAPSGIKLGIQ